MTLKEKCPILQFADLGDERGKLVVIEGGQAIPFDIKRVFYIYDSDSTVVRGQHANKESEFVLINVAGKSKVRITDGREEYIVELNKPMMGVYLPKMIWKDMYDFSSDSVDFLLISHQIPGPTLSQRTAQRYRKSFHLTFPPPTPKKPTLTR